MKNDIVDNTILPIAVMSSMGALTFNSVACGFCAIATGVYYIIKAIIALRGKDTSHPFIK